MCVCTQHMYKVPKGGSSLPVLCSLPFLVLLPHKNNLVGKFRGLYSGPVQRTKGMGKTVNRNSPLRSLQVLLTAPSTNTRLQEDCDSLFLSLWGTRGGNLCPRDKSWADFLLSVPAHQTPHLARPLLKPCFPQHLIISKSVLQVWAGKHVSQCFRSPWDSNFVYLLCCYC